MTNRPEGQLLARVGKSRRAPKMLLIVNPNASTTSARMRHLVAYALQGRYKVTAIETTHKQHATELAAAGSKDGYDIICALGGDGTVNEVVNGLAGTKTPFTCLPGGATNVFCRILGIPNDVIDATEHLLGLPDRWSPRPVSLGMLDDHYFTFSSGAGIDASVMERIETHPRLKSTLRGLFFTEATFTTFFRRYARNPPKLEVDVGDEKFPGVSVVVQNASPFTYLGTRPINISAGASLDLGTLSGAILTRGRVSDLPAMVRLGVSPTSTLSEHPAVQSFQGVQKCVVSSTDDRPLPFQADGEFMGFRMEATYMGVPEALQVVS